MRMHRIRAGGAVGLKRIADVLEIDFEAAEELKRSADKNASNLFRYEERITVPTTELFESLIRS